MTLKTLDSKERITACPLRDILDNVVHQSLRSYRIPWQVDGNVLALLFVIPTEPLHYSIGLNIVTHA